MNNRTHLHALTIAELREFVLERNLPEYRYRQLAEWLYDKLAVDFDVMTSLSKALRESLSGEAVVSTIDVARVQLSKLDGTQKFLFRLGDGNMVESVLMRFPKRITFCISSQVGCPLDCVFCQTGKMEFGRNLTPGEIIDQVVYLKRECAAEADKVNLVFMGMGEPMLNFPAVVSAIRILNDEHGLNMGARRITVSTAGHPRRMRALADADVKCSLALSLNGSNDEQRARLMPAVSKYSLDELLSAARYFHEKTKRRVTLEYVMLKGENIEAEDAARLRKIVRSGPFKLNLIPYNAGRDADFAPVSESEIQGFIKALLPDVPTVTVRRSRGPDIDAACGQLWTDNVGKKVPADGTQDSREEGSDQGSSPRAEQSK